jgi:glycosyltransferase involved in cell wall biosynthesis
VAEHDRLVWAGLERARAFSWRRSAERTLEVYREVLG